MKYFGSILIFTHERNDELMRVFRTLCAESDYIRLCEIGVKLVNSPCKRFWVSEERARVVCSELFRGRPVLDSMRPTKREMFTEIFKRVCALKEIHPDWNLLELSSFVVNSPAPKFYMEPMSAIKTIFKIKKGWYAKQSDR